MRKPWGQRVGSVRAGQLSQIVIVPDLLVKGQWRQPPNCLPISHPGTALQVDSSVEDSVLC